MAAILGRLLLVGALLGLPGCSLMGGGCPAALLEGTLFADPNGDLLVKEDVNGRLWTVRWPGGYGVRTVDGRIVVTDALGGIKAGDGDHVGIGGGVDSEVDSRWAACGNMDDLRRPVP